MCYGQLQSLRVRTLQRLIRTVREQGSGAARDAFFSFPFLSFPFLFDLLLLQLETGNQYVILSVSTNCVAAFEKKRLVSRKTEERTTMGHPPVSSLVLPFQALPAPRNADIRPGFLPSQFSITERAGDLQTPVAGPVLRTLAWLGWPLFSVLT